MVSVGFEPTFIRYIPHIGCKKTLIISSRSQDDIKKRLSRIMIWYCGCKKMWNASRFCVSSLRRGHANLLCIVPILVYVAPKRLQRRASKQQLIKVLFQSRNLSSQSFLADFANYPQTIALIFIKIYLNYKSKGFV